MKLGGARLFILPLPDILQLPARHGDTGCWPTCATVAGGPWGRGCAASEEVRCENCHQQKMTPAQLPRLPNSFSSWLACQICSLAPLKVRDRKNQTGLIATPVKLWGFSANHKILSLKIHQQ